MRKIGLTMFALLGSTMTLLAQDSTAAATGGEGGGGMGKTTTEEVPIWEMVEEVFVGQWYIMIPLVILSVLAVYIFVERFMAIQKATREEKNFMMQVKSFIQNGDLNSAKNLTTTTNHPVARMIGKGITKIGKPIKDIEASIENQGKHEIGKA